MLTEHYEFDHEAVIVIFGKKECWFYNLGIVIGELL
jgi:hypothetical protein